MKQHHKKPVAIGKLRLLIRMSHEKSISLASLQAWITPVNGNKKSGACTPTRMKGISAMEVYAIE